jgi:cytochrome c biogenesis protein CcdA
MLATFNPCGFAMLPAYLSFFVGAEGSSGGAPGGAAQALRVGAAVTAGFVAVFGAAGVAVTGMSLSVQRYAPWATLVIGLALVPLGLAVAAGRSPKVSLPRLQRGGSDRGVRSMALFGVSYATVSLSCTLPVFLAAVSTTFSQGSVGAGLAVFMAYAAGMGAVLTGLAVAVALAHQSMVRRLRGVLPHVQRASGLLLAAAVAYVAWYGWFELRLAADADAPAGPVDFAGRLSGRISTWISDVGPTRLGLAVVALVAVALMAERRRRRSPAPAGEPDPVDSRR